MTHSESGDTTDQPVMMNQRLAVSSNHIRNLKCAVGYFNLVAFLVTSRRLLPEGRDRALDTPYRWNDGFLQIGLAQQADNRQARWPA